MSIGTVDLITQRGWKRSIFQSSIGDMMFERKVSINERAGAWDRFFSHVATWNNGCWWWLGSNMGKMKYGVFWFEGRKVVAHRWIYEQMFGPIPDGYESHHICETSWCVNPYHLQMVTRGEHAKTKNFYQKTHCVIGHPLSGENLRIRKRIVNGIERNHRVCRACKRSSDNELHIGKKDNRAQASMD